MSEGLADIGAGAAGSTSSGSISSGKEDVAAAAAAAAVAKPDWMVRINRSLARGGKDPTTRYIQLATVGEEEGSGILRPFVRTVVFRGFVAEAALRPKEEVGLLLFFFPSTMRTGTG